MISNGQVLVTDAVEVPHLLNSQALDGEDTAKWSTESINQNKLDEPISDFKVPLDHFLKDGSKASVAESAKSSKYPDVSGPEYLKKSASDKLDLLWGEIQKESSSSGSFPGGADIAGIFLEAMDPTFHTPGDVMPKKNWLSSELRRKYIHSVGVVGKVKFVPSGAHDYTGIFKGADYGLVRFSSAAAPVIDGQPLAPGMGLKFLRDGVDSANLVSMFSVNGQPGDWNFFSNDFTTHIGEAHGAALQALAYKFATETKYIQQVGLSDMGKIDQQGQQTTDSDLKFPFELRFEPHNDVKTLFPKELPGTDTMAYVSQLESVPANSKLYNIWAMEEPQSQKQVLIGTLELDGAMTKSKFGDEVLYFRHQLMNDDVKIKSDWAKYLPTVGFVGCPYLKGLFGN